MSNIGLMEGAFFVGRKEVVDWINETLEINISKVEDTASGAIACQLLDIMHPGQVPMHKVNWGAKQSFEFVANYKILQTCFTKLHIEKFIDVDRLISGRYMDNLEFMQWFKRFYELSVQGKGDYDCLGQRQKGKGWESVPTGSSTARRNGASSTNNTSSDAAPTSSAPKTTKVNSARLPPSGSTSTTTGTTGTTRPQSGIAKSNTTGPKRGTDAAPLSSRGGSQKAESKKNETSPMKQHSSAGSSSSRESKLESELSSLRNSNEEHVRKFSELRVELESAQKERDFYFDKLRDIEVMLQEIEDAGKGDELTASIFKVLYATAEGFESLAEPEPEPIAEETF